jgi:hypothetical protein
MKELDNPATKTVRGPGDHPAMRMVNTIVKTKDQNGFLTRIKHAVYEHGGTMSKRKGMHVGRIETSEGSSHVITYHPGHGHALALHSVYPKGYLSPHNRKMRELEEEMLVMAQTLLNEEF